MRGQNLCWVALASFLSLWLTINNISTSRSWHLISSTYPTHPQVLDMPKPCKLLSLSTKTQHSKPLPPSFFQYISLLNGAAGLPRPSLFSRGVLSLNCLLTLEGLLVVVVKGWNEVLYSGLIQSLFVAFGLKGGCLRGCYGVVQVSTWLVVCFCMPGRLCRLA